MSCHTLPDFLEGAIDLHVHSSPDVDCRRYDDVDLATEAARMGMAGILIKSHQNSTVERAFLVDKVVRGIRVFGGLVLNATVGGLNPAAVRLALALGAKQIWMPTRDAQNHRSYFGQEGGLSVFGSRGELRPEVEEILAAIAARDCILGSGHLSPGETCALALRARALGIRKFMVTHPEWGPTCFSNGMQRELAAGGGTFFERCFVSTTHLCGSIPFATLERAIADVGVETTVLSTDLGQPETPPPAEGMRMYAQQLRSAGFSVDHIRRMLRDNPAHLLSLEASA